MTQGWTPGVPAQRSHRSSSGELVRSGRTPASVGICLRGTKSSAVGCVRTTRRRRVGWWWSGELRWPEKGASSSSAARSFGRATTTVRWRATGQTEGRGEAFARVRAQRHEPGTKGSPDGCRRRARAATHTGARGDQSYDELSNKRRGWGGSTGRGECNRHWPVTIWSPETRRR